MYFRYTERALDGEFQVKYLIVENDWGNWLVHRPVQCRGGIWIVSSIPDVRWSEPWPISWGITLEAANKIAEFLLGRGHSRWRTAGLADALSEHRFPVAWETKDPPDQGDPSEIYSEEIVGWYTPTKAIPRKVLEAALKYVEREEKPVTFWDREGRMVLRVE